MSDDSQPMSLPATQGPSYDPAAQRERQDAHAIPRRAPREARMVAWEGCGLFTADDVPEVPAGAALRIRVAISIGGEEVWFDRKPFPTAITQFDIHKRYGPGTYTIHLVVVDPAAPGSGLRGAPLARKVLVLRPRGADDVGAEPWPVNFSAPEIPRELHEEHTRRQAIRGEIPLPGPMGGGFPPMGPTTPYSMQFSADDDDDDDDDAIPPITPPGFTAIRHGPTWAIIPTDQAMQSQIPSVSFPGMTPAAAPPAPTPSPLAAIFAKPPEEILVLATGIFKLFKEISGGSEKAANAEVERERIRAEYELRKQEQAQQHAMFLEQMKLQLAAANAARPVAPPPAAPPVDADAIRRQALAEARMESLQREQQRLTEELRNARAARSEPQPDLMSQIAKIRETASALGMEKRGSEKTAPPAPSGLEQIADLLDTQGGKVLIEKVAEKFLGGGGGEPQQQPPPQQQQMYQMPPSPPMEQLPDQGGYYVTTPESDPPTE